MLQVEVKFILQKSNQNRFYTFLNITIYIFIKMASDLLLAVLIFKNLIFERQKKLHVTTFHLISSRSLALHPLNPLAPNMPRDHQSLYL